MTTMFALLTPAMRDRAFAAVNGNAAERCPKCYATVPTTRPTSLKGSGVRVIGLGQRGERGSISTFTCRCGGSWSRTDKVAA